MKSKILVLCLCSLFIFGFGHRGRLSDDGHPDGYVANEHIDWTNATSSLHTAVSSGDGVRGGDDAAGGAGGIAGDRVLLVGPGVLWDRGIPG